MEEQQVIRIGAVVNKYVWHYSSRRNKNGTYTLTGLDFKKQLAIGDVLDSLIPSALFRIIEEPVWADSTATFEGVFEKVNPAGIHYTVTCEYMKPVDRNPQATEAARIAAEDKNAKKIKTGR